MLRGERSRSWLMRRPKRSRSNCWVRWRQRSRINKSQRSPECSSDYSFLIFRLQLSEYVLICHFLLVLIKKKSVLRDPLCSLLTRYFYIQSIEQLLILKLIKAIDLIISLLYSPDHVDVSINFLHLFCQLRLVLINLSFHRKHQVTLLLLELLRAFK